MTVTKNLEYQSDLLYPYDTVAPPRWNEHKSLRLLKATTDTANIIDGMIVYLSGTTQANDVTECSAEYGSNDQTGRIFVVELEQYSPYASATTDNIDYPHRIPPATDVSTLLANYVRAANTFVNIRPLEIGGNYWLLIGNDATADVTYGYTYFPIAGGYVGAQGDPDGTAIAKKAHGFVANATFTNNNWGFFRYEGIIPFDDTA